jgi:hypothetical protein
VAVDRVILHDDGPYHWYCGEPTEASSSWRSAHDYAGVVCGNHNYYWYEETDAERLWPIPWDLDNAMTPSLAYTVIQSEWDDLSYDCTDVIRAGVSPPQMPATCDPLQRGFALGLRARIHAAMRELALGPLSEARVDARLQRWVAQLEPFVQEAAEAHPDELQPHAWRAQVATLRQILASLREEALLVGGELDAGVDAGTVDAGELDAGTDAGAPDDGDGGVDAGMPDAGPTEAGGGGLDAGADARAGDAG